ncbi:hypothetical protein [Bradyrhizobium sp. 2TAF24]|uniref:hypothetical protein n=1 Tax=Bradyrhizobium sp. 2TAF24 TaxID=3233011 RepID=UPI003F8FB69D
MTLQTIFRALAWASILTIVIVTDGPIGLRPVTHFSPNLERLAALALVGLLFALAYPNRLLLIFMALALAIGVFEMAQLLMSGRHPRLWDASIKVAGMTVGLTAGYLINIIVMSRRPEPSE